MAMRRERAVEFSQPIRQILFMVLTLIAVGTLGWFLYAPIQTVFEANVYLNGLIVAVFFIGVLAIFTAVWRLSASVSWLESFAADRAGLEFTQPPLLMASLSALLRDSRARAALSATSTRSILDSVAMRLDEARDIARYLGNLLIFLGLLGTFWGLSNTVPAVVDTIRSLAPDQGGDAGGAAVFDRLMTGLEGQLGGMGTAFASSLLGLAGSLVVGLLELFLGHAQNRFFRELEEWLSSITRVSVGEGGDGGMAAGLVEQNALQIEALGQLLTASEGKREAFEARIAELTDSVSRLTGALGAAEPGQGAATVAALERIAQRLEARAPADVAADEDVDVRTRLRAIDRRLAGLLEEIADGRQDMVADLRIELRAIAQAVAALGERR
jgi:hypothetical protein